MRSNDYIYGGLGGIQNLKLEPVYEGIPSEDEDKVSDEVLNPKAYKLMWDPVEGANSYVIYRAQISLDKKSAEELEEIPFALEENLDAGLEKYADKSAKGAVFLEMGMTVETVYVDKNLLDGKDYYYSIKGYKANTKRGSTTTETPSSASTILSKAVEDEFDNVEYGVKWYGYKKQYEKIERVLWDSNTQAAKKLDKGIEKRVKEIKFYLPDINKLRPNINNTKEQKGNFALFIPLIDNFKMNIFNSSTSPEREYYYAHSGIQLGEEIKGLEKYITSSTITLLNSIKYNKISTLKTKSDVVEFIQKEMSFKDSVSKYYDAYIADGYLRDVDSEWKVFNHLRSDLSTNGTKPDVKGTLVIYSDKPPCDSCKNIIMRFHHDYKGISINFIHNNKEPINP